MKNLLFTPHNPKARFILWPVLVTAAASACLAAVLAVPTTILGLILFVSTFVVTAFVSGFEFRLPRTESRLPISNLIAVWAMFWLGPMAGVIVAGVGSATDQYYKRGDKCRALFTVASDMTAMAVAAAAFYFAFSSQDITAVTTDGLGANTVRVIVLGTLLAAIVHFIVNSTLQFAFDKFESGSKIGQLTEKQFLVPAAGSGMVAIASILASILFSHFGAEFGLVVAPIAIFANIAYKIHIKRLEQKTREITEASRIHLATVEALATAIDARDQVGLGHVRRTQILAVGLGGSMGLSDAEINALRTGALLHDIGKLAVPEHILNKPGELTPAELEKTKTHSAIGASILDKVGFDYPVAPTVRYHHERWDGTGYPERLSREAIPVTARILSIADAYDTLRGERPYRPAIKRDQAIRIIQDEAGSRFDPTIVRIFLRDLERFESEIVRQGLAYEREQGGSESIHDTASPNYVEQIKLANREVFTLYELAREFASSVDVDETLQMFTQKVSEFVPYKTCSVYLLDDDRQFATAMYVDGANRDLLMSHRIKAGQGATGYVLKTGEKAVNVDPDIDFFVSHVELTQQYTAMVSIPLIEDNELIGAVSIYSTELAEYGEEHIRLLETITRIAAEAIGKTLQHDEARSHALTDQMTGLPNARCLQIQFEKELARASRGGSSFQLLMLDLDGFKAVNDTYGHKVGDELLREVGQVIRAQLRDYDFLARYGGDEFVALVPDTTAQAVLDLCIRIEHAVTEYSLKVDEERSAAVGVSLGASGYPRDGETFDRMIISADKAMYERKVHRKRLAAMAKGEPVDPVWAEIEGYTLDPHLPQKNPSSDGLIVELDESHVVSTAIN